MRSEIPAMVHPLGKHRNQPRKDLIELCGGFAIMELLDFHKLLEYSLSIPSGVYAGKMWKSFLDKEWLLFWYDEDSEVNVRLIIILD